MAGGARAYPCRGGAEGSEPRAVDAAHPEVISPDTARAVGTLLSSQRVPDSDLPRLRLLARFLEDASLAAAAREARRALEIGRWRSNGEGGLESSLAETEAELPLLAERAPRLQREAAVDRGWEALLSKVQRVQADLAAAASELGAESVPALVLARRDPAWKALDTEKFLRA